METTGYPIHRLAKRGTIAIELREQNAQGAETLRWEVSHNSKYGQPGPLAYKVDTLIINRSIEEASRPVPRIIKLGSLHETCQELGISGGCPRDRVKNALHNNIFSFITEKIR